MSDTSMQKMPAPLRWLERLFASWRFPSFMLFVLTFFTLVVGELAPKRIAMQRAEGWAMLVARPLDMLTKITRPAVWLLGKSTDMVVRLTGGDPDAARQQDVPFRSNPEREVLQRLGDLQFISRLQ